MNDLEHDKKRVSSNEMVIPRLSKAAHSSRGRATETNNERVGPLSFSSQQRQCPMCLNMFRELNEKDYMKHVADCFQ